MSFGSNYDGVAKFLCDLREVTSRRHVSRPIPAERRPLLVEMKSIRELGPAAALALVAELDRWQHLSGRLLRPNTVPQWDPGVRGRLASMGFFNLLRTKVAAEWLYTPGEKDSQYWLPFTSGLSADGQLAAALRVGFEEQLGLKTPRMPLYRSLVEAMKNAVEHAYPNGHGLNVGRMGNRWWMFGIADSEPRMIKVVFLDQGISIPASLPRSWLWEQIGPSLDGAGLTQFDGSRIASAMMLGRSRHKDAQGRGKGLADIARLTTLHPKNRIRIISRRGYYSHVGNETPLQESRSEPLQGTLLEWHLHLAED